MTRKSSAAASSAARAAASAAENGAAHTDGNAGSALPLRRSSRIRRPVQPPFNPGFDGAGSSRSRTSAAKTGTADSSSDEGEASRLDQVSLGDGGSLRMFVNPCAAALMHFHAHIARTEVIGYMGGFVRDGGLVYVLEAFPAQCVAGNVLARQGRSALREVEMDPESDVEVRSRIEGKGLNIVGWYHSHPDASFTVEPSHVDIENQGNYQQYIFKDVPFVGAILAPYNSDLPDYRGDMAAFYVGESGPMRIPYVIEYGHVDGPELQAYRNHLAGRVVPDEAVEAEAVNLIMFYSKFKQRVHLSREWRPGVKFIDKIRACLQALLPVIPKPGDPVGELNGMPNSNANVQRAQGANDIHGKTDDGKLSDGTDEIVKVANTNLNELDSRIIIIDDDTSNVNRASRHMGNSKVGEADFAKPKLANKKAGTEGGEGNEGNEEEPSKIEIERPDCGVVRMGPVTVDTVRVSNDMLAVLFSGLLDMANDAWEKPPEKKGKAKGGKRKKRKRYF